MTGSELNEKDIFPDQQAGKPSEEEVADTPPEAPEGTPEEMAFKVAMDSMWDIYRRAYILGRREVMLELAVQASAVSSTVFSGLPGGIAAECSVEEDPLIDEGLIKGLCSSCDEVNGKVSSVLEEVANISTSMSHVRGELDKQMLTVEHWVSIALSSSGFFSEKA